MVMCIAYIIVYTYFVGNLTYNEIEFWCSEFAAFRTTNVIVFVSSIQDVIKNFNTWEQYDGIIL